MAPDTAAQRHWFDHDEGSAGTPMRFCRRSGCDREVWEGDAEPDPDEPCPSHLNGAAK